MSIANPAELIDKEALDATIKSAMLLAIPAFAALTEAERRFVLVYCDTQDVSVAHRAAYPARDHGQYTRFVAGHMLNHDHIVKAINSLSQGAIITRYELLVAAGEVIRDPKAHARDKNSAIKTLGDWLGFSGGKGLQSLRGAMKDPEKVLEEMLTRMKAKPLGGSEEHSEQDFADIPDLEE